jgi:glycosyltransferase involved in cell wall biosynthesis|tara:strand:+ start:19967 stop:21235 length:1269 start_codon:yes stop_codon:yes gene_type:complete
MFAHYFILTIFLNQRAIAPCMLNGRILVLATTFPRWANDSTPRYVYDLSKRLAYKFRMIVLAPHHYGAKKTETHGKLSVRRFSYFKPERLQKLCYDAGIIPNMKKSLLAKIQIFTLIFSEFFSSYNTLKNEKIMMIHAHWMLPQGFIGVFLKKVFRVPLLVTVHGSDLFALKNIIFRNLQSLVLKNSNFVTVNSNAAKNELLKRFPDHSSKVKIIPMGVDINLFKKRNVKKPKKYAKNKMLLFVGRLSDQKGLQYLIDSIADIIKFEPKAKLLVIGSGAYQKTLMQRVNDRNVEDYVEFLGSMPAVDISKYYNYCDVFVMPSLSIKTGTESLGLSLLEAMSSGCAVVGTKVGGIPYVIKNQYNGLLVNQKDSRGLSKAVIHILKNKKESTRLGNNAIKSIIKNYSWDRVAKDFFRVYDYLLK